MASLSILLIVMLCIFAVSILFSFIYFIVASIPYYIMAKDAGFRHAWLAFIPYAQYYIVMTLPHREFNIFNKFITNNRKKPFWAYLIVIAIALVIQTINSLLNGVTEFLSAATETADPDTAIIYSVIMIICALVSILIAIISLANSFVSCLILWRAHYDLLMTYGMEDHAMWASIVSIFVPLVMVVFSFIIMNREPEYGFGNYYLDSDTSDNAYYE